MTRRSVRAATAAVSACCALGLTGGCGPASHSSAQQHRKAEKPLVTVAEANRIVDTYQRLNNEANAKRSAALLAKSEGGAMLAFDRAYYTQAAGLDPKEVATNLGPFVYVHRAFFVPPAAAKADWFVLRAQGADFKDGKQGAVWSTDTRYLVFRRTGAGWRAVAVGDFSGTEQKDAPRLALDPGGLAEVVDPAARKGTTAPAQLADMVADLYATGGARFTLATTKARDRAASVYNNRNADFEGHAYADYKKAAPRDGTTYALRTADGGALVLNDSAVNETVLAADLNSQVSVGKKLRPFVKKDPTHLEQVVQHEMQTEIGVVSAGGSTAVYGIDQQATGVDVTPYSSVL